MRWAARVGELHLQRLGICCVFVQFLCTTITHRKSTSHSFQEAVVYLVHIIRFHFHFLPIHLAGWVLSFRYKMGMPCSFSTLDSGSSPLLFGPTTVFISNLHLSTFLFIRFYRCVCDMAFCAIIADGMCAIFFFLYLSAICVCVCWQHRNQTRRRDVVAFESRGRCARRDQWNTVGYTQHGLGRGLARAASDREWER